MTDRDDLNRNRLKIRSKTGRYHAAKPYARPSEPQSGFFGRIKEYALSTWPFRILSGGSSEESLSGGSSEESPDSNESPPILWFADRICEARRDLDDDAVDVGEENERETTPEEASAPTRAIESERDRQPDRNEASLSERVRRHGEDREIPSTRHFDRVKERSNDSNACAVPIRARPLERSTPNPFSLTPSSSSSRSKRVLTERKRPPVAQKRPGFSVSTFLASQSPFQSSFYRGGTTYGGASAAGRPAVKRIKPVCNNDISKRNVGMSQTSKRILETLESIASPLEDARRIPQSVFFPSKSPVTFSLGCGLRRSRASTTRRTDRLNLSLSSSRPPPVELLKFPLSTLPQNLPVHLPEENISAKVPKTSTTCSGSGGGGKMKSPKTTAHCASVRQEERSEEHWNNKCRAARRRVEQLEGTVERMTAKLKRAKANLACAKARLEALTEKREHGLRQSAQPEEEEGAVAAAAPPHEAAEEMTARIHYDLQGGKNSKTNSWKLKNLGRR